MTFSVVGNELQCLRNGVATPASLASNVTDLQVLYGVDTSAPPDGVVDIFQGASPAPVWDNVLVVRLCLDMQTANNNISPAEQTYTNCRGITAGAGDRRFHRVFSTTVALRNCLLL